MAALELIKGTLDVWILKTLSWGPLHGYGVSRAIRRATGDVLTVEEGALYPALRRLEAGGLAEATWGTTDTGREARFYHLTDAGVATMGAELLHWSDHVSAMARVLEADGPPA
jgi:transcriptional regulator